MKAPERVLTALAHEEPDRVPAFESTFTNDALARHYGVRPAHLGKLWKVARWLPFRHKLVRLTLTKRALVAKGLVGLSKLYQRAGIDVIPSVTALFPRQMRKGGFVDEFGRRMQFEYYHDGTEILGYVGGVFQDFDEYSAWEPPDPQWEARLTGFLAGRDVQERLDDEIFSIPSTTGMMEVTWEGFGIANFARLLAHRKQARKVFDDRGKFAVEVVKIVAEHGARLALVFDDYGYKNGLFMSPRNYRAFVLPWLKRICAAAHKRDCQVMLHSDGDLMPILDDIVACGVDALNPIEPSTANPEYDIFKLHATYGNTLTLVGNVPPNLLAAGRVAEVEAYTRRLLTEIAPGGGYILASGHSINPAVTVDRFEAMRRTKDRHGGYPITTS